VQSSMRRPSLLSVTLAHITVDMHTGSLVVLLPLLLASFDLGYTSAAAIITANNLVIAVAQPFFGTFGDRRTLTWLVWAGCLLTGAAMVSVLFLPSYQLVIATVMLSGIGSAAFHPEALSRVRAVSGRLATTGASIFFAGGNIGFALGPTLAVLMIGRFGEPGALILLLPTLLALAFLTTQWRTLTENVNPYLRRSVEQGESVRQNVAGTVGFLMLLIILRSTTVGGLQTFIPLYFRERGTLSPEGAAFLVTVLLISGVLGTLFGGVIADRVGRKVMMATSMLVALAGLYLFLYTTGLLRIAALAISGASISAAWPVLVVMIQEAMPKQVGLASGLSLGTSYGATGLGIAALGSFADGFGLAVTMNIITALPLGIFLLTLFLPKEPGDRTVR
jgi:FSR family fosmidomycin resistance protein-like MFS transporter